MALTISPHVSTSLSHVTRLDVSSIVFDLDTNLYRSAAATLKTDGELQAGGNIYAKQGIAAQMRIGDAGSGLPGLIFGPENDTWLYRSGVSNLITGGSFNAQGTFRSDAVGTAIAYAAFATDHTPQYSWFVRNDGAMFWGSGALIQDTNLYRSAVGTLKTDGALFVGNLGVPITVAAVGGAQANKFPVYNQATGALVGYVPIYAT